MTSLLKQFIDRHHLWLAIVALCVLTVGCSHQTPTKSQVPTPNLASLPKVPPVILDGFSSNDAFVLGRVQMSPWDSLKPHLGQFSSLSVPFLAKMYLKEVVDNGAMHMLAMAHGWQLNIEEVSPKVDLTRDLFFSVEIRATPEERFRHLHGLKTDFVFDDDESNPFSEVTLYIPSKNPESLAKDLRIAENSRARRGRTPFEVSCIDGFVVVGTPTQIPPPNQPERRTPAREFFESDSGLVSIWLSGTQLRVAQGIKTTIQNRGVLNRSSPQSGLDALLRALAYLDGTRGQPIEFEDMTLVMFADKGLNFRVAKTHTSAMRDSASKSRALNPTIPTLVAPTGSKAWLNVSFAIDTSELSKNFGQRLQYANHKREPSDLLECISKEWKGSANLHGSLVTCLGSTKGLEGLWPIGGRIVAWTSDEAPRERQFAFVVAVKGEVTEEDIKTRFKDVEVTAFEDGHLLFFRTHPEARLGQLETLSGGSLSANIDLSGMPEWTKHTKARAFESLKARHIMTPNATHFEVRISSNADFRVEPNELSFEPWKLPIVDCHQDLHELYREWRALDLERTKVLNNIPNFLERFDSATLKCEQQNTSMQQVYREDRSMAHLWAGLVYLDADDRGSAEKEFELVCKLSSALTCERPTPNDILCPAPLMGETANLSRDVSDAEVLEKDMIVYGCNINPSASFSRDEIQSYFGGEVLGNLKRGKPLPKTSVKRPN